MSETETRDPAVEPTPAQWVDEFLLQPRDLQVALAGRVITESRAVLDLAAARAEVARLREAMTSLADQWGKTGRALSRVTSEADRHGGKAFLVCAEALQLTLAAVEPSGEAESGEDEPWPSTRAALAAARAARSAPVSSGGQADGEGESLTDSEIGALANDFVDAVLDTVVSPEVGAIGLTVGDVLTIAEWLAPVALAIAARPVPQADGEGESHWLERWVAERAARKDAEQRLADVLAACPVLTREALASLLGEHAPVYDYHDGHFTMECEACGFRLGGVDREDMKRKFGQHFADLVLAGEQR